MEKSLFEYDIKTLIGELKKQKPDAQRFVYEKYFRKMHAISVRYLKNGDLAHEAVNDAYMKFFDKISNFKEESDLEVWLRRIVINASIDVMRKDKQYKKRFITDREIMDYGEPKDFSDDPKDVISLVSKELSHDEILNCVLTLPPASRLVFNLYAVDKHSHKEIAQKLNVSEGTSKWHLSNARKLLIQEIKQQRLIKSQNENEQRFFRN